MSHRSRGLCVALFFGLSVSPLTAQTQSPEFRVNAYTSGSQRSPSVASDGSGDFLVVFGGQGPDGEQITAQLFDQAGTPSGIPFRANVSTGGAPSTPAVAVNAETDFMVVWADGALVKSRSFNPVFGGWRGETVLCDDVTHDKSTPAIASNWANGEFFVAWRSDLQDGDGSGIYARRTYLEGQLDGPEFRVNTYTTGAQSSPKVAAAGNGNHFVIVWEGVSADEDSSGVFGQRFGGGGEPLGGEFRVNTTTTGSQKRPSVTADGAGNFFVVWQSGSGGVYNILAQRYAPSGGALGTEFRVNASTGGASDPSIGVGAGAAFFVVWQDLAQDGDAHGILVRRFNNLGAPLGDEFRINTTTTADQTAPAFIADGRGATVVVWNSDGQDGDQGGLYASRLSQVSAELRVNTFTTGIQGVPDVSADAVGNKVVVWTSAGQDGSLLGIFGQRFGTATPAGAEFRVNTATTGYQLYGRVASAASGAFVVVWMEYPPGGIQGQRFSALGAPLATQFRVSSTTTGQALPTLAAGTAGDFVVTWTDYTTGSVLARRFDSVGSSLGPEFRVNSSSLSEDPQQRIAKDASGNFIVVWQGRPDDGGASSGIFAQRFAASGAPLAGEFRVNTPTAPNQYTPGVAYGPGGDFVVVWESYQDGWGTGVFGQRFASSGAPAGSEFQVNVVTIGRQFKPLVTWRPQAGFLVAWQGGDGSGYGILGRRFAASGVPLGGDFRLNAFAPGSQVLSGVAAAPGLFVVVSHGGGEGSSYGTFMRRVFTLPNGDADGNGAVTVTDVLYLINHLFAGGPFPTGPSDADGNGSITVSDILYLINYLFAGGPAPV